MIKTFEETYGTIKGGDAVLMEIQYFRETHFPASFAPTIRH